jgi:hypothetical protein
MHGEETIAAKNSIRWKSGGNRRFGPCFFFIAEKINVTNTFIKNTLSIKNLK